MSLYNFLHKFKALHRLEGHILSDNFRLFRWVYVLYNKLHFTKTITKNGVSYKVPVKNGIGLQNLFSSYEEWMIPFIQSLNLPADSTFIDVGINTGQTLLKTIPFHKKLNYIGIEPNTYCYNYVTDLILLNKFSRAKAFNIALSDTEEDLTLQYRYKEDIMATTSPKFRKYTNYAHKITVPAISGDLLCLQENIHTISLIKIDVEGGELKVLQGFTNIVKKERPIILCEILPIKTIDVEITNYRNNLANGIITWCNELEYSITNINTQHKINTVKDLDTNFESSNYILTPNNTK